MTPTQFTYSHSRREPSDADDFVERLLFPLPHTRNFRILSWTSIGSSHIILFYFIYLFILDIADIPGNVQHVIQFR